jgi:di/tricarboxylate transporter
MTTPQILAFAVIAAMMVAFIWGRFRYDLVAALALLAAIGLGLVPFDEAFLGFSDDIVIIVGSALLVSAAVARSGAMELLIQRYFPKLKAVRTQLALLVIIVIVLSAFVKNIGALAIMIPIAFQFARRSKISPSVFLMPMAFGALLGGLMTQVGTSPNIIVSRVREEMTGTAFRMFDFTPVGAILAVAGGIFLVLFYWILPQRRPASESLHEAIDIPDYVAEARITAKSTVVGKTVADLLKAAEGNAKIASIMRAGGLKITPLPDSALREGDMVLLEGDPQAIDRLVAQAKLSLTGDRDLKRDSDATDIDAIEAVIGENSFLVGLSAQRLALYDRFGVNVLAVSRRGERLKERPGTIIFRLGDIVVLQGDRAKMPEMLREFGCLPLAERPILMGSVRQGLVPLAILGAAMGSTALGLLPVTVAFFAAAVLMVLFRAIPLRDVYGAMDGPILVMLAAIIPVSDALRTTGATDLIASWLVLLGTDAPAYAALALILVAAMAVTPFLNNAATVLVMAPIAASFASGLGYRPEAFLMAVAIGAGCDFLTPIGHQCNTLVMGPGGYRFGDYSRLGLPLSIIVVLVSVPALMMVWPLQ